MPTCLVVGCQSGSGNDIDKQYKYGSTPLPKSPEIRNEWLEKINRLDYKFVDKARICFRHFYEEDFIPQSENLGARGKPNKRRQNHFLQRAAVVTVKSYKNAPHCDSCPPFLL